MKSLILLIGVSSMFVVDQTYAQEPVTGAAAADALFTSSDPQLNRNKQAAWHIERDLLEAGHWELADKWLTERYIQHNPNAASGRAGVIAFFTKVLKVQPKAITEKLTQPVDGAVKGGQ